ncbi:MAG TPA: hypothetical protein PKY96_08915 [Flavobacteriales bacterium]|nr:hypothetical protein [Flavobacteriales bacterium]
MRLQLLALALLPMLANAQDLGNRSIVLQEINIPNMPGIQSFAWGQHNGEWLVLGGRTDGLHRRQPFAAFLAADNNTSAYVVNPQTQQVWSASLSTLPTAVYMQLQSTNLEHQQSGNTLYIIGGYGYSTIAADHITHPRLTAIDVPGMIAAIKNAQPVAPHVRSIVDNRMEVTGGYLGSLNGTFLLVGGQRFVGRYNPQGPDFGPGFIQQYTNAIRRFTIDDDGTNLGISNYEATVDTVNLHRRDYNLVAQVFPDGSPGYTIFSGVFQYGANLPWLNTVDVSATGYTVVPDFEQLLNQYHSAHLPAYSVADNRMSNVFFGGIGRYYFDANDQLIDDANVPFVNTISRVERFSDGSMEEMAIGEMPALLGSGAEFILEPSVPAIGDNIIDLDALTGDTVLAGHIVGGIQSSAQNIFFVNDGTQSDASARVFRVLLVSEGTTGVTAPSPTRAALQASCTSGELFITIDLPASAMAEVELLDSSGRFIRRILNARVPSGSQRMRADVRDLAPGAYLVKMRAGDTQESVRFVR